MEQLDGLKRNDFCDFDKPCKRSYQKGKIESNDQSKEGGQQKQIGRKRRDARQSQKLSKKSIVARIVQEPGLSLLNSSKMD